MSMLPNILKMLHARLAVHEKISRRPVRSMPARRAPRSWSWKIRVKALEGDYRACNDKHVMDTKRAEEEKFKAAVMANPQWKSDVRQRLGRNRRG